MIKGPALSSRLRKRGLNKAKIFLIMDKHGKIGVKALREATPIETGKTAGSWSYIVTKDLTLRFMNSEVTPFGVPIPILLMYGYTRRGRNVPGNDYVRRTLSPIIQSLKDEIRKEML